MRLGSHFGIRRAPPTGIHLWVARYMQHDARRIAFACSGLPQRAGCGYRLRESRVISISEPNQKE
jgi:hypothetical protein